MTLFTQFPAELEDRVDVAQKFIAETGADCLGVEIHVPPKNISLDGIQIVRELLEEFERQVSPSGDVSFHRTMHFPFLPNNAFNIGDLDPVKREKTTVLLRYSAEFAATLDIKVINTHLNATCFLTEWNKLYHRDSVRNEVMRNSCETVNQVIEAFEANQVTLSLENVPYPFESIYDDPPISPYMGVFRDEFAEIFDSVQSTALSYCFDALHANILFTTAQVYVENGYDFGLYWGLYPTQEPEFHKIVAEGPFYSLTGLEYIVSNVHLGGQKGAFYPGGNPLVEGSMLDPNDESLLAFYSDVFQLIAANSRFRDISAVLEVKEEDYYHSKNLPASLVTCWNLIQGI